MDQDTNTAPAVEQHTAGTAGEPEQPRRRSEWGKVQVKRPAEKAEVKTPAAPATATVVAEPATKPTPRTPARTPAEKTSPASRPRPQRSVAPRPSSDGDAAPEAEDRPVGDDAAAATTPARRKRRRGGRGRGGAAKKPPTDDGEDAEHATPGDRDVKADKPAKTDKGDKTDKPAKAPAKKSGKDKVEKTPKAEKTETAEMAEATGDGAMPSAKKRRRRGGRGRGGKNKAATTGADTPETQRDDATPDTDDAEKARPSRRRSGQRPDSSPGKRSAKSIEEQVAAGGPTRGIRTSRTRTGRIGRRREPTILPPRITDKVMVITEHGDRDQIAVLEEDVLVQHYVTRAGATSMVGNVYLGRVQNVLPGMEAAFVDVGRGRNGVLYAGEVNYSPEDIDGPAPRIEQLLKPGQAVMVQVTKDPMGGKGARLTANLSLAGRYLVLAPNQDLQGISRRLGDDARKRLKSLLKRVKPPQHGVIVRTAAEGATEEALEADLRRLLEIWDDIQKTAKKGKAPTVLYEEPELTVRVVRDLFTDEEFKVLDTDSPRIYGKITDYLKEVAPDLAEKVKLHDGSLSAFEEHRIVEQIHKALDKKVWLPSGGYLFIERTEAMTIVDVNTGKSVGKTNLEATVVNTNLEAAREVARQLRLRDIGGIIVIDFIDMLLEKNKKKVEDTMRESLALDKTRSQVFEIGPLGLMQVTRKRVSSGLVESFSETCPTCEGRGIILTYDVN